MYKATDSFLLEKWNEEILERISNSWVIIRCFLPEF
jgi:hypothetical protein